GGGRDIRKRQRVVHALALRGQVVRVLGAGRELERHDRLDRDAQLLQRRGLDRGVRQKPDAVESERADDRRLVTVGSGINGPAEAGSTEPANTPRWSCPSIVNARARRFPCSVGSGTSFVERSDWVAATGSVLVAAEAADGGSASVSAAASSSSR